jgi:hypothetical protein
MEFTKNLSIKAQATLALIVAQILFKLIFELEGAAKMAAAGAHEFPFVQVVYFLIALWAIIGVLCLLNIKRGYLFSIIFGIVNFFPLVLLCMGLAPYLYRPFFNGWITLSLIYFSYREYKSESSP